MEYNNRQKYGKGNQSNPGKNRGNNNWKNPGRNQEKEPEVHFKSKNMNYIYNVSYFDEVQDKSKVNAANRALFGHKFPEIEMFKELESEKEYHSFTLKTQYPGLLMGTGYLHDIKADGAYKVGFSFDYVNGNPYYPGSSLKGILRSVFPGQRKMDKDDYRQYLIGKLDELGVKEVEKEAIDQLEKEIFDFNDIFLGAYPEGNKNTAYMKSEYITPHKPLKNPNPISLIKVGPDVKFKFSFLLHDGALLTADQKAKLFEAILLDFGIGAKTNVGFGKFEK